MKTRITPRLTALLAAALIACSIAARAEAQHNRNASLNWVRSSAADGCTSARGVAQKVDLTAASLRDGRCG